MEIVSGQRVRLDLESKADGVGDRGQGSIFGIRVAVLWRQIPGVRLRVRMGKQGSELYKEQVQVGQTDYRDGQIMGTDRVQVRQMGNKVQVGNEVSRVQTTLLKYVGYILQVWGITSYRDQ